MSEHALKDRPVARLALEDGTVFTGYGFGATGSAGGEVVFNTSMTGYQEILTDPSYKGQIVTMTYPLIGNYGINPQDVESRSPHVSGLVIRELSPTYSNYRATESLHDYLLRNNILGISGIDTRALTRRIRVNGSMRGLLTTEKETDEQLVEKARSAAKMEGADWVQSVKPEKCYGWTKTDIDPTAAGENEQPAAKTGEGLHVVAIDCGAKQNILRHLVERGIKVTIVPPETPADQIMALKPDGLFVSNGPGDPAALDYAVRPIADLLHKLPVFGICLGHQLLARAIGATTYKLKFGHRGGNQPVKNLDTGRIEITSQNQGFSVDRESLERHGGRVTHVNLNDQTVAGFRHKSLPVFSVQYHPEASPGPHDANYLFDEFVKLMRPIN